MTRSWGNNDELRFRRTFTAPLQYSHHPKICDAATIWVDHSSLVGCSQGGVVLLHPMYPYTKVYTASDPSGSGFRMAIFFVSLPHDAPDPKRFEPEPFASTSRTPGTTPCCAQNLHVIVGLYVAPLNIRCFVVVNT